MRISNAVHLPRLALFSSVLAAQGQRNPASACQPAIKVRGEINQRALIGLIHTHIYIYIYTYIFVML